MPRAVKILTATFCGKPAQEVLQALRKDTRAVDVIVLPEEWQGEGAPIDTDDSPLLREFRALATEKHAYVVCPVDRPAPDGKCYNTALMIDRENVPGHFGADGTQNCGNARKRGCDGRHGLWTRRPCDLL